MIWASLYRDVFIKNLLRYLAEKILLLNTTDFRGDYPGYLAVGTQPLCCDVASLGARVGRKIRMISQISPKPGISMRNAVFLLNPAFRCR